MPGSRRTSGIACSSGIAAGNGEIEFGPDDGRLATTAQLPWPNDVALDLAGNLLIADSVAGIRQVNRAGILTLRGPAGWPWAGWFGLRLGQLRDLQPATG